MDNMGWNSPSAGTNSSNVQSSLWRDVPRCSNADYGITGAKMNLGENLFHPSQGLQDIDASNSSKDRNMIQQLAPSSDFTKFASNTTGLCTPLFNMPNMMSPLISSMPQALQTSNGMGGNSKGIPVASLESLDCLLSTTNSNTDTSVEDDVISMMFPDCRNLWSFNSSSAISSGESENKGLKKGGANTCHHANNMEETVSQSSSYQCQTRPSSSKRKNAQEEIIKPSVNYSYLDIFQSDSSNSEGGFKLITEKPKKPRLEMHQYTSNINFQHPNSFESPEPDTEAIAQMKEMIYRAAVFRPVNLGLEVVEKPKRKNVKISSDPQTVAARQRRERISERMRILQRLVPGGSKMDTASMLDEAANYLKFLRSQVKALETLGHKFEYPVSCSNSSSSNLPFSSPLLFNQTFPMYPFFQPQNPN